MEVNSSSQAAKLLKLKSFGTMPIAITALASMNTSHRIISEGELFYVEEEMIEKLRERNIIVVSLICIRKDGQIIPEN